MAAPDDSSSDPATPEAPLGPAFHAFWLEYKPGGLDKAGRIIERVWAVEETYILYFSGADLYYETTPTLLRQLGNADVALARINRLLPWVKPGQTDSYDYRQKVATLELVADAVEMIFCGHPLEGLGILNDIRDKLQTAAEGKRQLWYQCGTLSITVVVWVVYLALHGWNGFGTGWEPWMLAASLGMAGGTFSVCLSVGSLKVSINQQVSFLFIAGATRSAVALLSGIGLLLAMRAKMIAGLAYHGFEPVAAAPLQNAEMFFCFLAGFSETFVPNILRDSERNPAGGQIPAKVVAEAKAIDQAKALEQAKGTRATEKGTKDPSSQGGVAA